MEKNKAGPDKGAPMRSYTLVRSTRKTLAIYITKDAVVEVRAPMRMPIGYIERFVVSKEQWINSRLEKRVNVREEKAAFALKYGDTVLLCGKPYPIVAKEGNSAGFDEAFFYVPPGMTSDGLKEIVKKTYKLVAKKVIAGKIEIYARRIGVEPARVRITSAKTRWGSCSAKKSLNFSWRLIMAEETLIDYVVVHELAHIKELNHSPRFWAHVESIVPDYNIKRQQLKQLQEALAAQNWDAS